MIVVTNQAGIGRGYYTEPDFYALTDWMRTVFVNQGARVDEVYFCPFHPEYRIGSYRSESEFRKPSPGMLLQAAREHQIDLERSIMVGDKASDMEAGKRAGVGKLVYFGHESDVALGVTIHQLTDVILML